jgi:hypothetical protein
LGIAHQCRAFQWPRQPSNSRVRSSGIDPIFLRRSATIAVRILNTTGATEMHTSYEQALLDHQIIRRAMHNAAGQFEVNFTEFSATWFDPETEKTVDFTGSVDSQISILTAQIQGSSVEYILKDVFPAAELRAFNYLIQSEHTDRRKLAA